MEYVFLLSPHANIRYYESLQLLARKELACMLHRSMPHTPVELREIGGRHWLSLTAEQPLSQPVLDAIARHSSLYFSAIDEGGLLSPLSMEAPMYLPGDAPEILKYKGKTNASFTNLMINCALSASDFSFGQERLAVLDPMCGKGTTLFCALQRGYDATGIEITGSSLRETREFFTRYLKFHRIKHQVANQSLTLDKGKSAPCTQYTFAMSPEAYKQGNTQTLRLIEGDAANGDKMCKKGTFHLLVADLPYGVQHAPKEGGRVDSFSTMLGRMLPKWRVLLKDGGALALSYNEYTLKKETLAALLSKAGYTLMDAPPYDDFSHWVEQAVQRNLIIARNR